MLGGSEPALGVTHSWVCNDCIDILVTWSCLYPSELGVYQGWLSSSKLPSLELGLQTDRSAELPECACDLLWDGPLHLPGSEVVLVGPDWSCSLSLSLPQSQASKMDSNRLLLLICLMSPHEIAQHIVCCCWWETGLLSLLVSSAWSHCQNKQFKLQS